MTEPSAAPVATPCDFCGASDPDAKHHFLTDNKSGHYDCLPQEHRDLVIESNPHGAEIIAAADAGTHGVELRAFIKSPNTTKEA